MPRVLGGVGELVLQMAWPSDGLAIGRCDMKVTERANMYTI